MLETRWGLSGLLTSKWFLLAGAVLIAAGLGVWIYAHNDLAQPDLIEHLTAQGKVTELAAIARGGNDAQALRAASALGTLAKNPQTSPVLMSLIKDPRPPIRERIVLAVAKVPAPREHTDTLVDVLRKDQSAPVRAAAAEALGQMKAMKAVPFLADALSDDEIVYDRSSRALKNILGVIPGFAEGDSPARRRKMANYYRLFHKNYGRAIENWQQINETQATQPAKPHSPTK